MTKYYHSKFRNELSRSFKTLTEARKAALNYIEADYAYNKYFFIYERPKDSEKIYQIGNLICSIEGSAYYQSNPTGKPRPNSIKPGTWKLNKDGTVGVKVGRK